MLFKTALILAHESPCAFGMKGRVIKGDSILNYGERYRSGEILST